MIIHFKNSQCESTWFIMFFMSYETCCSLMLSCCYGSHYGFRCGIESHPTLSSVLPLSGDNLWQPQRQCWYETCSRKDCHSFWCGFTCQVIWNQFFQSILWKNYHICLDNNVQLFFSSYPVELFTFFNSEMSILLMGNMDATAFQHIFIPFD